MDYSRRRESGPARACTSHVLLIDCRWIASDKSSRLPVSTFQLALKLHGVDVDSDEVECMVANMIYRVGVLPLVAACRMS